MKLALSCYLYIHVKWCSHAQTYTAEEHKKKTGDGMGGATAEEWGQTVRDKRAAIAIAKGNLTLEQQTEELTRAGWQITRVPRTRMVKGKPFHYLANDIRAPASVICKVRGISRGTCTVEGRRQPWSIPSAWIHR